MSQLPPPPPPKSVPTPEELEAMMILPVWLVDFTVLFLQILIYGVPCMLCLLPFLLVQQTWTVLLMAIAIPFVYALSFVMVAGLLNLPFQKAIVKGVFPRDSRFPLYAMRRCYGICWTSVYYFKPLYNFILSFPFYKWICLRLFGYKGSININLYPDSWIRDLPLLRIENGVYISNRCMLGTNVSLIQSATMVGNVTIKKGALIGADAKVGLGSTVGENTEFSIEVITGLHVKIGSNNFIGAKTEISHYVKIGSSNKIGICCFIGTGAVIEDNLTLPSNTHIPDGANIQTMEDLNPFLQ
jgi:acetyltransferase-like isoleucine patch superfamily enzyme